MIRKTLKHSSKGSLSAGVNYVLRDTDSKNAPRPTPPKIISGDKDTLLEIEKDMKTQHTYVHSVLSFTSDEMKNLSDDDKQQIAESYIEQLAAGLPSPDRLAVLAVDHGDDMHFLCLRKDLETDKSYQPYVQQRGDKYRFDLWNESMQEQHSALIDPNDPAYMRLTINGEARPGDHEHKSSLQNQVLDDISSRFSKGEIKSRDDIIDYLKQRSDIEISQRRGKDNITDKSITIKSKTNPDMQAIRLKGALFEKGWPRIDSDFKPKRATPKTPEPSKALAELNGKLKVKAEKKYGKSKSNDVNDIHDLLKQNQSTLNDMIMQDERIKILKGEFDRPERKRLVVEVEKPAYERPVQTPALDLYHSISFEQATEHCKNIDLNEQLNDYDIVAISKFMTEYNDFKNDYDDFYDNNHEAIMLENDDEVLEEREIHDDQNQNVFEAELNLKNQMNQLESTLNNEMKQAETQMNGEAVQEQQKTQTRKQKQNSRGGGRAPKVIDNSKELLAIWKQGDSKMKQNDMRNYIISQKNMRDHDNAGLKLQRKKKKSKKDDDKK